MKLNDTKNNTIKREIRVVCIPYYFYEIKTKMKIQNLKIFKDRLTIVPISFIFIFK